MRDLRCTNCGAIFIDEFADDYFRCTSCSGPVESYYGAQLVELGGVERRADGFVPVTFGSVRYDTPDAWAQAKRDWQRDHVEELHVEGDSKRARRARLEEDTHRSIQQARRRGMHDMADQLERRGIR